MFVSYVESKAIIHWFELQIASTRRSFNGDNFFFFSKICVEKSWIPSQHVNLWHSWHWQTRRVQNIAVTRQRRPHARRVARRATTLQQPLRQCDATRKALITKDRAWWSVSDWTLNERRGSSQLLWVVRIPRYVYCCFRFVANFFFENIFSLSFR